MLFFYCNEAATIQVLAQYSPGIEAFSNARQPRLKYQTFTFLSTLWFYLLDKFILVTCVAQTDNSKTSILVYIILNNKLLI